MDWCFRICEEMKVSSSAYFLTLTYEDINLPVTEHGESNLCKRDVQLFVKRLRKEQKEKVRYYLVGEYGSDTDRAHYHVIVFNLRPEVVDRLDAVWGLGFVHVGQVNPKSIVYCTKYVIDSVKAYVDRVKPFALCSLGLGKSYLTVDSAKWHLAGNFFVTSEGYKQRLPRYYREKLFGIKSRERHRNESIEEADKRLATELTRLTALHPFPEAHYFERIAHEHERLNLKSKVVKPSSPYEIV